MEMGLLSEKIPWSIADPSMAGWYHESVHATTGNGSVAVCPHFAVSQNAGTRQQACLPCAEEAGTQQNKGTR